MAKISQQALQQIEQALEQYVEEVKEAGLALNTETTYLLHSNNFVRWLKDDFSPGDRLKRHRSN